MRRLIALCLSAVVLFCGCTANGSAAETGEEKQNLNFYYTAKDLDELSDDLTVQAEKRNMRVYTLDQLLDAYFKGPASEHLASPFPDGTHVVSISKDENGLVLVMSGEYFTLSGIDLSLAACCLVNTVCEYAGVEQITVVDEMERVRLTLAPDSYLLTNEIKGESDTTFTLYFADSDMRYLLPELRQVTLSENVSAENYLLRQLIEGPREDGYREVIPEGTEILGVSTEGGICTVNFTKAFVENQQNGTYGAYMAILGVVNTLTSLDEINSVQFLIDGETVILYDIFPLDQPISRNLDAVGPVRTASGEVDVNIYVRNSTYGQAFFVPCRVKQSISQPLAEAVVRTVLSFEPMRGFENPVPYGTELLGCSISGSVCYVDVSAEFVPEDGTEESEQAAVYALVSALTDLSNISSVMLTIEGETDRLQYVDISEPLDQESVNFD